MRIPLTVSLLLIITVGHAQLKRYSFTENKMGSPFTIILYGEDSLQAVSINQHCFSNVDSLVSIFSDYMEDSELNQLCKTAGANKPFQCSPALFDILVKSEESYVKSKGKFDITVGPLTRLWRYARKQKEFPDSLKIKEKLQLVGFNKISIDKKTHSVTLLQKGMQLDLGGIAQGYIAQQVIEYLKKQNVANALVDVSGDIVCIGSPPGKKGWTIAVNAPESDTELLSRPLLITNRAVTTSGDIYQYLLHQGKRYSHIIDPFTGYGISSQRNVTVIATDGTLADWLTKACSILPISEATRLATRLGAAVLIVELKKGKPVFHSSKNFNQFWKVDPSTDEN